MRHISIIFGLILALSMMSCAPHDLVQPETDIRLEDWKPTMSNQLLSDHVSSLAANSRYVWSARIGVLAAMTEPSADGTTSQSRMDWLTMTCRQLR